VNHLSRVLVAVDFSKPARDAFEFALALSKHHGAQLIALQAVPPDQRFRWHARDRHTLTTRLRRRAEQVQVEFKDRVQRGDPAEIILLHARSLRPDVIVLGTHQRRGIERLRVGSVAERVMANATVPVLLVPTGVQADTITPFNRVAVAVDSGSGTNGLVEQASVLASTPAERITVLDNVSRPARSATEINRAAEEMGADLLVVGVPTRGVISRALFGTTAARLLRAARVPVLAVSEVATAIPHQQRTSLQRAA
jgi:nucleotide-binding universal stress UspA family protein